MNSGSQADVDGCGARSGGKIVKQRRIAARKTPYDRPTPSLQQENPNWLNGLVFPAKFVAGGASKLISSIWNPKSWGSRSSSSSSSDSDSDSEGGIEDDLEDNENLSDGGVELNQNKGSSSGKNEILYLVEQLLMLEHYSRDECDRLKEIIDSRVVDDTMREEVDAGPKNPDIRNQAIMEARKLITENTVGSSSKSDLVNAIHGSKSLTTPNRDYLSGRSWSIQNEIQRLRSKATEDILSNHQSAKHVEVMKPNEPISLEAQKHEDETVNLASDGGSLGFPDMRTIQEDVPTDALSSLPTIEEHNQMAVVQMAEEQDGGGSTEVRDANEGIENVNASQGSSSTIKPDSPNVTRAVTRSRRYTRRGRGRAK